MKFRKSSRLGYRVLVLALALVGVVVAYLMSGDQGVFAQTPSPGELAATRIVANAQEKADAARRQIDAPTRTPLPTRTPTPIPTDTDIPTLTPMPVTQQPVQQPVQQSTQQPVVQVVVATEAVIADPTIAAMNRNAEIERLRRQASIDRMWSNIGVSVIGFALMAGIAGIGFVVYLIARRMGR